MKRKVFGALKLGPKPSLPFFVALEKKDLVKKNAHTC